MSALTKLFQGLVVSLTLLFATEGTLAQSAESLKKTEAQIRQEMLQISAELGVTCGECHNLQNFTSPEKPLYKISLDHIRLTQMLRERGMNSKNGQPEASCYMCHRGQLKFNYKAPQAK
ncbi:MAG: hypothetical protein ACLGGX_05630 [Bdellovibrionia bacterium]